jgi:hypothetical protein
MELYIETDEAGVYGIIDTFLNETIVLNTKTLYTQDITAVFKGFTNNFSVQASPNNVKLLDYFGYTNRLQPTNVKKRAKLFIDNQLYKEGIVTIEGSSWINEEPSLFELSFSDGKQNLTEILAEDTFKNLIGGDITWNSRTIKAGLQTIQSASDGTRWFIPFVSTERIFTLYNSLVALPTDNIVYRNDKPITSEDVLLPHELRPAIFLSEILQSMNSKYDIKIDPLPFIGTSTQLTDLAVMCVSANVATNEVQTTVQSPVWFFDAFREERFDIIPKPLINAFELRYLGYGGGSRHDATFEMLIRLRINNSTLAIDSSINYIEVWEVNAAGLKLKKLNYSIIQGSENRSSFLRIGIGLDVFTPNGGSEPSTLIKPLIAVFVSSDGLSGWKTTDYLFVWAQENWVKTSVANVQPNAKATVVNLFKSLPEMKLIDFVKSIYTMFAYKKFNEGVLNDFYYTKKTVDFIEHQGERTENDLTPFADLSKVTKKTNTKYDAYDLKHFTSDYQQNKSFAIANGQEWGQLKYPLGIKPKSEFKIETKFTAPVFSPIATDADANVYTFYPFGSEAKLNESETRFIYDTITKEFPIFYYQGSKSISTAYAFVDTELKQVVAINKYNEIGHKSRRTFTGVDNYISSLFNIVTGDYIDQNTLYQQGYKIYIEDTLSGKKLIHTIDLDLPTTELQNFDDNQEIIIKENKYSILESNISLTDGKTKLTLLNK